MPYATTHILLAIILIEIFREYFIKDNRKFPRYYILFAAIGGIIPDLDIGAFYIMNFFGFSINQIHRTFFHTIFIPLALFLIGILIYYTKLKNSEISKHHMNLSVIFFILSGGAVLHLILDSILAGQIIPFYPFSTLKIGLNLIKFAPINLQELIAPTIDAILLIFWIFWMEFKLKISDYF
jgi:membrane-bound metal-dependent hydrolase YbcI (DUF457 family)